MKYLSVRGVLAGLLAVLVALVCVRLGFWQLDRLEQRRTHNAELEAALAAPPVALEPETVDRLATDQHGFRYRRAVAQGVWDPSASLLLRGRSHDGRPGVHLVTPLRLDRGAALLVDRGWLPAADATTADPRPARQAGRVDVRGILHPIAPGDDPGARVDVDFDGVSYPTYQRLTASVVPPGYDLPILPYYLERAEEPVEADQPVGARPPELDEGPHLGYAVQWFSFAAIALFGYGLMVARGVRRRPPTSA